jgi:hypothetical protein
MRPLTMRRRALGHGDIHLWLLDLDEHPEFQREDYALLPHDERIRADRMATEALFTRRDVSRPPSLGSRRLSSNAATPRCPRIAQEIAHTFGIDIDKDIVHRVLAKHYRPEAGTE